MREKIKKTDSNQPSNNQDQVNSGNTKGEGTNRGTEDEKDEGKKNSGSTGNDPEDSETEENEKEETGSSGNDGLTDTSEKGIEDFLALNTFQDWDLHQDKPIETNAPHGEFTQTFINETAEKALRAGDQTMPVGSILVKIMYQQDAKTEFGRALMVKTASNKGNSNWTWYEGFASPSRSPFYGPGLSLCTGCHSNVGNDFVSRTLIEDLDL